MGLRFDTFYFLADFCSRPTALQDRTRDSDEEDVHDRDYDVAALANNLSQAFRYTIYDNDDNEEVIVLDSRRKFNASAFIHPSPPWAALKTKGEEKDVSFPNKGFLMAFYLVAGSRTT